MKAYPALAPNADATSRRPHLMNANILLENTPVNRALIWAWLDAAVTQPDGFCASGPQEQAVFTLVVHAHRVPLINACPYIRLTGWNRCQDLTKSATWFLQTLSSGAYEVVEPSELDTDGELVREHQRLHQTWLAHNQQLVKNHPSLVDSRFG